MKRFFFYFASIISFFAIDTSMSQAVFADDAKVLRDLCTLNVLMHLPIRSAEEIRFPVVSLVSKDEPNIDKAQGYGYSAVKSTEALAGLALSDALDNALNNIMGYDCYHGNFQVVLRWQEEKIAKDAAVDAGETFSKTHATTALTEDVIKAAEEAFVLTILQSVKRQALSFQVEIHKALQTKIDYFSNVPGTIKPVDFTNRTFSREVLRHQLENYDSKVIAQVLPEIKSFYESGIHAIFNDKFDRWLVDLYQE